MKKSLLIISLCGLLILCTSSTALAKLSIFYIDGQRIVVDFYVASEQAWQNTPPGAPGYWEGLAWRPDPDYRFKIWYPFLADTFDMTLGGQVEQIEKLEYAGIKDWRIGYYWDTIPMKASMFGGMVLGLPVPNMKFNFNSSAYFPPTACDATMCLYIGRTGNKDGLLNGAIINPLMGMGNPINPNYVSFTFAKWGMMGMPNYYTMPRSEAQDHWISFPDGSLIYNDDLNYNADDTTVGNMGPFVDGRQLLGAWTVSDMMPQLWPPNHEYHTITISDVTHPQGTLFPVTINSVMQDEEVYSPGSGNTSPDAEVDFTDEAAVVFIRAERNGKGSGRVYHIEFTDSAGNTFTFQVGVPNNQGKNTLLIDDGPLYDSMEIKAFDDKLRKPRS